MGIWRLKETEEEKIMSIDKKINHYKKETESVLLYFILIGIINGFILNSASFAIIIAVVFIIFLLLFKKIETYRKYILILSLVILGLMIILTFVRAVASNQEDTQRSLIFAAVVVSIFWVALFRAFRFFNQLGDKNK